jgi:hypothetical protein
MSGGVGHGSAAQESVRQYVDLVVSMACILVNGHLSMIEGMTERGEKICRRQGKMESLTFVQGKTLETTMPMKMPIASANDGGIRLSCAASVDLECIVSLGWVFGLGVVGEPALRP